MRAKDFESHLSMTSSQFFARVAWLFALGQPSLLTP
jgi:hypothetical protein